MVFWCLMHVYMPIKIHLRNTLPTKYKALKTQFKPISGVYLGKVGPPGVSSFFMDGYGLIVSWEREREEQGQMERILIFIKRKSNLSKNFIGRSEINFSISNS